jgi:osmotically-inducible protein OsmY
VAQQPTDRSLVEWLEQQLAAAGLQVAIEDSDGSLVLNGVVDTAEARDAAADLVAQAAPDRRIDNQLEVETVLPTDIDDFSGGEPSAEAAESIDEIAAEGGEIDPDFTDQPILRDPVQASGPSSSDLEDPVESGDAVYTPPNDPVISTDAHGRPQVLGGFAVGSDDDLTVEPSAMDSRPGDEALADAVRRELREDGATSDLEILVVVRQGVVHLRGRVAGLEDAENAEAVAARVPGVREVEEELEVPGV